MTDLDRAVAAIEEARTRLPELAEGLTLAWHLVRGERPPLFLTIPEPALDFAAVWKRYPKKADRCVAHARFVKLITSQKLFTEFERALTHYLASENVRRGYVKNFASFLGTKGAQPWREWIEGDPTPVEPVAIDIAEIRKQVGL